MRGSDSHALRGWDTRAAVGDETALAGKVGCTLIWCVLTQNCTHSACVGKMYAVEVRSLLFQQNIQSTSTTDIGA